MAASLPIAALEHEIRKSVHSFAPKERLCGAIGLALRRGAGQEGMGNNLAELMPVPPPGSRPSSAFSHRSRNTFRGGLSDVSIFADADNVFREAASPPPLTPVAPATPRPDSAVSTASAMWSRKAFYSSSEFVDTLADVELVCSRPRKPRSFPARSLQPASL